MRHLIPALFLIALWGAVAAVLLTPETPGVGAAPHPAYAPMDQGVAETNREILLPGAVLGCLMILGLVGVLAWSVGATSGTKLLAFGLAGLVYEAAFVFICISYQRSVPAADDPVFLGPFPAATTGLLFGVGFAPCLFMVIYVVYYHSWIAAKAAKS